MHTHPCFNFAIELFLFNYNCLFLQKANYFRLLSFDQLSWHHKFFKLMIDETFSRFLCKFHPIKSDGVTSTPCTHALVLTLHSDYFCLIKAVSLQKNTGKMSLTPKLKFCRKKYHFSSHFFHPKKQMSQSVITDCRYTDFHTMSFLIISVVVFMLNVLMLGVIM
jgi:hypothetical protein